MTGILLEVLTVDKQGRRVANLGRFRHEGVVRNQHYEYKYLIALSF